MQNTLRSCVLRTLQIRSRCLEIILKQLDKYSRPLILGVIDTLITSAAFGFAFWLRLETSTLDFEQYEATMWHTLPWLLGIRLLCGVLVKQYNWAFRHASLDEAVSLVKAGVAGSLLFFALCHVGRIISPLPPRTVYVIEFTLSLMGMGFVRFFPRYFYNQYLRKSMRLAPNGETRLRTLILGAGGTGELLLRDILRTRIYPYQVVGFIDDSSVKWNTSIHGCRVLGGMRDLPEIIRKHRIDKLLIAIPDLPATQLREIVDMCADHHIRFKIVPSFSGLVTKGDAGPITLKDIQPDDLLDRAPVAFDNMAMASFFVDKTVLVTGAAGSIGSEICRQVCRHGARRLVALDIDENGLYFLRMELEEAAPKVSLRLEIASVRDRGRIAAVFDKYKPAIVFHAAAHKHVPLMEYCPAEALKNNVLGTWNVASAAHEHAADRFVLISTDKAIHPANVMGASKWLAEVIVRDFARKSKTGFMAVRFGNVLGSNGSLVPILQRQIARGGPVTITHPRITRFFMTIPEAVGLVLLTAMQNEGMVCVLDMGEPVSVDRLARQVISLSGLIPEKDIPIVYTGLRPGEKMYEELFTRFERLTESSHPKIRIAHCEDDNVEIPALLRELEEVTASQDPGQVRDFLARLVPGYKPEVT